MSSRIMAIGMSSRQVNCNRFASSNGDKRSIERRGYNDRIGDDGWPDKQRHPAYVKRF